MRRLLIILSIFTSCASYNTDKLKEFRRFSYIFDVYNSNDSIKVFVDRNYKIYKTIKLK